MKKKYGLFKVLAVMLFFIAALTYVVKDRSGAKTFLALGDVFLNYLQSFYYFFDTALFILVVGGFYGVLNKIPAYKKMLKGIANKMEGKSKKFVIVVTILLAIVSSVTGLNTLLLLIVPMIVSIILLLGYDKLVALSATVVSISIGFMGGVFITTKDPASYYSVGYTTLDKLVGLSSNWAILMPKILLFLLSLGLLLWYIISHIKSQNNEGSSYALTKNDTLLVEVKDKTGKEVKLSGRTFKWPLITILSILFILLVLGYLPWNDLFGIDIFDKFHTWLTGLAIGDFAVFPNVVSANITAFGTWGGLGNYLVAIMLLIIFSLILILIYGIKFDDAMDGFLYGVKKMLPSAIIAILAYTVLVCSYNHGFMEKLITMASDKFGDNAIIHSSFAILGSIFSVDLYYVSASIFSTITSNLSEGANLSVYAVMFQSLYGLVQIIGPTSIMLIVGLTYLEVPYKTWLKYIWRLVVGLLIVSLIVLMIISLL